MSAEPSEVDGITFVRSIGKWRAQIPVNKEQVFLGVFFKFEDAVEARKDAEEFFRRKSGL